MFFLCFFKDQKPVSFQITQKTDLKKHKKQVRWVFLNPAYLSVLFCNFPLIARSGTSHVIIKLIGCVPHTYSIGPWY